MECQPAQFPPDFQTLAKVLAPDFAGALKATDSRLVRQGSVVEVHRHKFDSSAELSVYAFLEQFRSALADLSNILTAEFQVTAIEAGSESSARFLSACGRVFVMNS